MHKHCMALSPGASQKAKHEEQKGRQAKMFDQVFKIVEAVGQPSNMVGKGGQENPHVVNGRTTGVNPGPHHSAHLRERTGGGQWW